MVVVSHVRRAYRFCNTIPEPFMPRRKAAAVPLAHAAPTTPAGRSVIPIRHQTLTGMTVDALRERILHGEYPEGAPLRQDAIANEQAYEFALRAGDVVKYGELNWQFHSTLYAPAARAFTMGIVGKLHQQSDRYLCMQLALTHGETRAKDQHRAIANAVKKSDAKLAAKLMREHILNAGRSLVTFIEEQRDELAQRESGRAAR